MYNNIRRINSIEEHKDYYQMQKDLSKIKIRKVLNNKIKGNGSRLSEYWLA